MKECPWIISKSSRSLRFQFRDRVCSQSRTDPLQVLRCFQTQVTVKSDARQEPNRDRDRNNARRVILSGLIVGREYRPKGICQTGHAEGRKHDWKKTATGTAN